jgi:pimeloyl-ACP methyl ester carboxylesterase
LNRSFKVSIVLFVAGLSLTLRCALAHDTAPLPPPREIAPIHSPDGVTFEAYEWGNPSGKPIVFIHGIYQSALSWAKQIKDPHLAAKYRLVAIDLRGHGAADKPAGAEFYREGARWANDITSLMDTLRLSRPVMVAWSYGGRVLNDYLLMNGDGRLGGIVYVAARSVAGPAEAPSARRGEASQDALSSDPATFIKGTREFVQLCFGKQPTSAELEWLTAASMQTPLYVRKQLGGRPLAYADALRSIRVPTLIIQGDIDAVVPPEIAARTHQLIPHSTLSIYHGVGHSSFFETPDRFNAELARFVESTSSPN